MKRITSRNTSALTNSTEHADGGRGADAAKVAASDHSSWGLGILARLPAEIRHIVYDFALRHIPPSGVTPHDLSLRGLASMRRASKSLERDIDGFIAPPSLTRVQEHGHYRQRAVRALLHKRKPLTQLAFRAARGPSDEIGQVVRQKPEQRTVDGLIKCGLLPESTSKLSLTKTQQAFLCSDSTVNRIYRRVWVNVELMATIPDALFARGALANAIVDGKKGEIVDAMLQCGLFDPNAPDKYGRTALHAAVFKGDIETIRLLMANGADPNQPDNGGASAEDVAKRLGRPDEFFAALGVNPPPPQKRQRTQPI
jgi:hypothetical protein